MKKRFLLTAVTLILISAGTEALSQKFEKSKITPVELKEWDNTPASENFLSKISTTDKAKAKDEAQALAAFVLKAMLHRIDSAVYPIDDKEGSVEKIALDGIDKLSPATFKKAKERTLVMWGDPHKKTKLLGKFSTLDFKKKSIAPDIKRISNIEFRPVLKKTSDVTLLNTEIPELSFSQTKGPSADNYKLEKPAFNRLDLVLRKVHCVDETDPESPGDDDMVIGGLLVGASGNTNSANSLASGHYDDGDVTNHGAYPFGTYSLNTTPSYPKVFYCILQLIEVDTDEADAARALTDVMKLVGTLVSSVNPAIGALVVAVAEAVQIFTGWLIDDDPFYPFGITLNLNNANKFGADGRSSNWHTGNISDHDGIYRIGFYWQLKN